MQQTTELLALLQWQLAMGATEAIADAPEDWRIIAPLPTPNAAPASAPAPAATPKIVPISPASAPSISLAETIAMAENAASNAKSLDDLRAAIAAFEGCALKKTARSTVFASGNLQGSLLVIGEAPSSEDDLSGEAFSGEAGLLLDRMLAAIGLSRQQQCALTNGIFWRPPGGRPPSNEEAAICLPFLRRLIALMQPKHILLLGSSTAKSLLGDDSSMARLRTKTLDYESIPVRATFAPSFLLRQPLQKKLAWQDLLALKALLENNLK